MKKTFLHRPTATGGPEQTFATYSAREGGRVSLGKSSSPRAPTNIPRRFVAASGVGEGPSVSPSFAPFILAISSSKTGRKRVERRGMARAGGRRQRANRRIGNEFRRFLFFPPRGIMAHCQTLALMGKLAICPDFPNNSKPKMGAMLDNCCSFVHTIITGWRQ